MPDAPQPPTRKRGPRSDASRNRALVADAAVAVFTEAGIDATVADVARRANVGNATVFRHFPSKDALLAEVTTQWLEAWGEEITRRMEAERENSLRDLVDALFDRLRRDRFTLDVFRARHRPEVIEPARVQVEQLLTVALERAIAEGTVRPGTTYADLTLLVLALACRLVEIEETDPASWHRCADLTWAAIAT